MPPGRLHGVHFCGVESYLERKRSSTSSIPCFIARQHSCEPFGEIDQGPEVNVQWYLVMAVEGEDAKSHVRVREVKVGFLARWDDGSTATPKNKNCSHLVRSHFFLEKKVLHLGLRGFYACA